MKEIEHIDEYLSAAQVGITMASIGLGFLGEPAIAKRSSLRSAASAATGSRSRSR